MRLSISAMLLMSPRAAVESREASSEAGDSKF